MAKLLKIVSGLQGLVYLVLLACGIYGAYGFTSYGVNNPLVWALEGKLAPYLWLALVGAVINWLWLASRPMNKS